MKDEYPEEVLDLLVLDADNQEYKLKFRPFTLSSGYLFVGDLRKQAAKQLNAKAEKIQLSYNGQELNEDHRTAKYYGIKRNSIVSCKVSELSGDSTATTSCSHDRTTAGEVEVDLNFITALGQTSSTPTQELRQLATDFPRLDGLSTNAVFSNRASVAIVISKEVDSLQGCDDRLELSSNYNTTDSGATSTAFTSIEGDMDHKAAVIEAKATADVDMGGFSLADTVSYCQEEESRFPSDGMSETLGLSQDLSIVHPAGPNLNHKKFLVRLLDVASFLENGFIKLVAIPDYRSASYMIFDLHEESTRALWTTTQNIAERMLGGTLSKLPDGLRTAIFTSRAFGIGYIWLPTICTIADDEADVERQQRSSDGIFDYAVGLLKTPGSVSHQYIEDKILQHRIRVIELPACENTSTAWVIYPEFALERYLTSHSDHWTPYSISETNNLYSTPLGYSAFGEFDTLLQEGSGVFICPQQSLPGKPNIVNEDAAQTAHRLIGSMSTGLDDEITETSLQLVHSRRISLLAFHPNDGHGSRNKGNPVPPETEAFPSGMGSQLTHLRAGQHLRDSAKAAPTYQSFDDLGNDGSAYACTGTVSRKRKRQHGCAMKCPWSFADLGTDGPGCPRHICERQRHPSVKHFKGHHGKNEEHHRYSFEDMRVPSRAGAGEREKMVYLIFKLVHGWNPSLQPLKEFLRDNQHILIPNPYLTKANGECVACDSVDHSDRWPLPEAALLSMTLRDARPGRAAASSAAHPDGHAEHSVLPNEFEVIPSLPQPLRFDHIPELQRSYLDPSLPQSSGERMAAHQYVLPVNQHPPLVPTHGSETGDLGSLQWLGALPFSDGPTLPTMHPVNSFWNETFNEATSHTGQIQLAADFTAIAQPVDQDNQVDFSEPDHITIRNLEGSQSAEDYLLYKGQGIPKFRDCGAGYDRLSPEKRLETMTDSSGITASEISSAEDAAHTESTSVTVQSAADRKALQKRPYIPTKICICNDSPMNPDHGHLKCQRNAFCQCCSSFRAYSEEGRRFLEKAGETNVCFCEDYLWPQEKHAQCHGKAYCNCCKKWRAYSEEGQVRLNQLMLQLAATAEDRVPMDAWENASVLPEQPKNVQQELRKLRKGKDRAC